ncbi:MAG: HEPN domain-containing protein [Bacteroides sp.]|nr:HEPN domain-containing protein [Eubacterium sp.]MCM1418085.1 HEPN domain-containing protein [Roseburia sp.]MCM1462229.1 HEPN domain-containing protein [Bacteroides sp.]
MRVTDYSEGILKKKSKYMLDSAKDDLETAKLSYGRTSGYNCSVDRAYFAIYHAMSAVMVLDGFRSRRHPNVIYRFERNYINRGKFNGELSPKIRRAYKVSSDALFKNFYYVSAEEAEEQIANAEAVLHQIESYLTPIYQNHEKETTA